MHIYICFYILSFYKIKFLISAKIISIVRGQFNNYVWLIKAHELSQKKMIERERKKESEYCIRVTDKGRM